MVPKMPAPSLYKTRIPIYTLCGLLCRNGQVRFTHGTHPSASAERVHGDQEERGEAKGTAEQEVRGANSGGETERERTKRDMDQRIKGLKRSKSHFWGRLSCALAYHDLERKGALDNVQAAKISTLPLKTSFRIGPQNVPRDLGILAVQRCLAGPETVNLASEVLEDGQSKTQNLPQTTLNLGGGVVWVRSSERAVRAIKRHL